METNFLLLLENKNSRVLSTVAFDEDGQRGFQFIIDAPCEKFNDMFSRYFTLSVDQAKILVDVLSKSIEEHEGFCPGDEDLVSITLGGV